MPPSAVALQKPAEQRRPLSHATQVEPAEPQAESELPSMHAPDESQQPAQVSLPHGLLAPHEGARPTKKPRARPRATERTRGVMGLQRAVEAWSGKSTPAARAAGQVSMTRDRARRDGRAPAGATSYAARMVGSGSDEGPKPPPAKKVEDTTQPGLPLGDEDDEIPTDEHAALGDTEESTDEHAVPQDPAEPSKEQPATQQ